MRRAPQHAAGLASLAVGKQDPKILQDFLALKFALSRRTAKAMIDGRNVWVDRKCVWIARYALKTGDIVGNIQTSENGTPILHFQLHKESTRLNPSDWLRR